MTRLAGSPTAPHRQVLRARVVLAAGEGVANARIAVQVGVSVSTVRSWRSRFVSDGVAELGRVAEGRGRKPVLSKEKIQEIVDLTRNCKPAGQTHWSVRTMAKKVGVSPTTVQRIWAARGLRPHVVKTFELSNDPRFEEKLIDVVGLYLDAPEKSIVLCMDEKSSAAALDRAQASLPLVRGRAATMTHDYQRNGTTTLFAALDVLTGKVISSCLPRHRHEEFLKFLNTVNREVPNGVEVHMILDSCATHQHADVVTWLARHKRFHLHFTPASSSWLDLVERWFRELTDKDLRRGVFHSVPDLIAKIQEYLDAHNDQPKPFVWTAKAQDILAKVQRGRVALQAANQN